MTFIQRLKLLCNNAGTTPTALCKKLDISVGSVTRWNNGFVPSISNLNKIAQYFNVSVDYLVTGNNDPFEENKKIAAVVEQQLNNNGMVQIPIYGNVCASLPAQTAIENIDGYEEIPASLAATGEFACLRIKGDSMEPEICENDIVVVRIQPECNDGDIAIVMVDGEESTCKRVRYIENGIMLVPINKEYDPKFYSQKDVETLPVRIWGKVVRIHREYN